MANLSVPSGYNVRALSGRNEPNCLYILYTDSVPDDIYNRILRKASLFEISFLKEDQRAIQNKPILFTFKIFPNTVHRS